MGDYNPDRIGELTAEAWNLPHGDVQVRLLEEAVNLADIGRDIDRMFDTRMSLLRSAPFSGHAEKAVPAFAWCLSNFEREPVRFRRYQDSLLWNFKNILHNADEMAQLTRDQVEEVRSQMASLYVRCGYNMRPVHYTRLVFAMRMGDRQTATKSYAKYRELPRDSMADCVACEADTEVEYRELIGEYDKSVDAAEPSLAGRQRCAEVPHRTYSYVLRPLALLGDHDRADQCQRRGYALIRTNAVFLGHVGLQIAFLIHRSRERVALGMFERHLSWALATKHMRSRYLFYLAAKLLLARVAERKTSVKMNLPHVFPGYDPSNRYEIALLLSWLAKELDELGARFDARNGNRFFTQELPARLQY